MKKIRKKMRKGEVHLGIDLSLGGGGLRYVARGMERLALFDNAMLDKILAEYGGLPDGPWFVRRKRREDAFTEEELIKEVITISGRRGWLDRVRGENPVERIAALRAAVSWPGYFLERAGGAIVSLDDYLLAYSEARRPRPRTLIDLDLETGV